MDIRKERDSIGEKEVPADAYYGVQSLRANENFPITGTRLHPRFIDSLAEIKKAAALANCWAGKLPANLCDAICRACDEILAGGLHDQFITDAIQGGAGTSANMNANEVIANRAIELLGGQKGDYTLVHPNDYVNMAQSTNDVIPTAGKMTAIKLLGLAAAQLARLEEAFLQKSREFDDVVKMGRTQMQDAVPIRLGQEFGAYAAVVRRDIARLSGCIRELRAVNMGGTAIGTCLNADKLYVHTIVPRLAEVSGLDLIQAENLIDATQNLDCFVVVSAALKTCAVSLSKISNDLRMMSSGPRTGFCEINLPARQNGSSIMPGKVNPVIPEVMTQVAYSIIGNDVTVTMAAEAGQLELNAFEPVIFYKLFESISTLANGVSTFVDNCVLGITANRQHCRDLVDGSVGTITAICPKVGYQMAAEIAKKAVRTGAPVKTVLEDELHLPEAEVDRLLDPYSMT